MFKSILRITLLGLFCLGGFKALGQQEEINIIGGQPDNITHIPYQVAILGIGQQLLGGGVVLSEDWILTARHVVDNQFASSLSIRAGVSALSDTTANLQNRSVQAVILHPDYNDRTFENDLALLKLTTKLDLNCNVQPIVFDNAFYNTLYGVGAIAQVSGWGYTVQNLIGRPDILHSVEVGIIANNSPLITSDFSRSPLILYTNSLTPNQTQGGCKYDSGGPLTVLLPNYGRVLVGIVTHGESSCLNGPTGYARIAQFHEWITQHTGINNRLSAPVSASVCTEGASFSFPHLPTGYTIQWQVSPELQIVSGQGTTHLQVAPAASGGLARVQAVLTTNCNRTIPLIAHYVWSYPTTAPIIVGSDFACSQGSVYTVSQPPIFPGQVQWQVSSGPATIAPNGLDPCWYQADSYRQWRSYPYSSNYNPLRYDRHFKKY